jgi:hypothetical protein
MVFDLILNELIKIVSQNLHFIQTRLSITVMSSFDHPETVLHFVLKLKQNASFSKHVTSEAMICSYSK